MTDPSDLRLLNLLAGAPEGGAETFFVTLTAAFQDAGVTQRAVIRRNPARAERLRAAGVDVGQTRFGGPFDVKSRFDLAREVRSFRPSVVMSYMERASRFMPGGAHLKVARLGGFYKLKYFRRCDELFCITQGIRDHVIRNGWPAERAHYMPNFAEAADVPAAVRADFDTPEGVPLIFTPGRLHKVKGLDTLISAARRIPDAHVWIAGEGPERAALEAHAANEGMRDRVRFLGWRTDTGRFFKACDVVAFPSRHEPFGTVTLEAWAYGKPLVATDADGPAETIRAEEDGLIVPKDDVAALAEGFRRVLDDRELAERLVANAGARHAAEFTREACVRRYLDLFARLC